jgi:hypothetical protein
MRAPRFVCFALVVMAALLALGAANANSGSAAQSPLAAPTTPAAKITVKYKVTRFARQGHRLIAYGTAIARYMPGTAGGEAATVRKAFHAPVKVRSTRRLASTETICPILTLDLQQLDLNLLGLRVHADRVFLTLKADSTGGLLGNLLCGLASSGKLTTQATQLNWIAKKSGLAGSGTGYTVAVPPSTATANAGGGNAEMTWLRMATLCPVLELTLGPLDANLLGLLVHLDQVHLTIVADSDAGILGSLFCQVFNGGTPTP